LRVMVRAMDKAGNVRDEYEDIDFPESLLSLLKKNIVIILLGGLVLILVYLIIHFLFGHKIMARLKRTRNDSQERTIMRE
ncbi:MAG: hypothetical protein ACE5J0_02600, partial [Candidatus Paceibacterales bacterium]